MPKENSDIIRDYKSKLEKENALIISAKNRYDVNESLQDFNSMVHAANQQAKSRNKVTYVNSQDDAEMSGDDNPDNQVRLLTSFRELPTSDLNEAKNLHSI